MRFYSGFGLKGEEGFFASFLKQEAYVVAGFSYGAIKAFEYACHTQERIDTLQLFSPAFFQEHPASFKRLQLKAYKRDSCAYMEQFYKNMAKGLVLDFSYHGEAEYEDLEALLAYEWCQIKLDSLQKRGTTIEVYLGTEDQIIETQKAYRFFTSCTTCNLLKGYGHLLQRAA